MRRVLLLVALLAAASTAGATPQRAQHECVRGGELWFYAADGTKLVGHRFGKGTTAVILAHQSQGSLCDWLPYARRLAARGFFVFPIDFRGYGFSQPRYGAASTRFAGDLAAATKALRRLGKKQVFLVGASMGGIASVVAGANIAPPVDGVVSISSPARYGPLDGVKAGARLRVPVLYLAALDDDNAGYDFSEDAKSLYAASASADKRLELLPGTAHGIGLMASSTRAKSLVESFLKAH